jgi:hypothetical protein
MEEFELALIHLLLWSPLRSFSNFISFVWLHSATLLFGKCHITDIGNIIDP